jgi:hypothetical protein
MGLWLKANAAPDATVLLEPIGYIGYYSELWVFDEVGLVTPRVTDLKRHGISGDQYFAYLGPDYAILHCDETVRLQAFSATDGLSFSQLYQRVYVSNPLGFDVDKVSQPADVLARNSCYEIWELINPDDL